MLEVILATLALFPHPVQACLNDAYPDALVKVEQDQLIMGGQRETMAYTGHIERAGILDHLGDRYDRAWKVPQSDPGRARSAFLMNQLYGTPPKVQLEKVWWAPSKQWVLFQAQHGAKEAMERVSQDLDAQNNPLAKRVLGTYHHRAIAHTTRWSAHAYGLAIDLHLPKALHHYWQWSGCKANSPCPYPVQVFQNKDLKEMVTVFEQHGFIWGGQWVHFDTMHFEYRPELLTPSCGLLQ